MRGIAAAVAGTELPPPAHLSEVPQEAVHLGPSRFRYCTTFVIEGDELDADALERELERLGDSLMVVGDPSALKVHVHTDDPGAALTLGTAAGTIEGVEIADMRRQTEEREERLLEAVPPRVRCAVVAVAAGEGNRRLFERLGAARVVEGGQSMNPSTADLLEAVEATGRRRRRSCCCPTTPTSSSPPSRPRASPAARSRSSRRGRCRPGSRRSSRSTRSARPRRTPPR